MKQEVLKKKAFDLQTHIRDGKGTIVREQPYRLTINGGVREFERPPGSGYVYTEGGDLIRKPSAEALAAKQKAEPVAFDQSALLKQIEELKAANAALSAQVVETEDEEIPEVPAALADNSEEIKLMQEAGALKEAKALANAVVTKPAYKPQFINKKP